MTIYMTSGADGYVYFKFYDSDWAWCEKEFIETFGSMPQAKKDDAFRVMEEIDDWYTEKYHEGCVRFEFG